MLQETQKALVYSGAATRFELPADEEELLSVERQLESDPANYDLLAARGILCMKNDREKAIASFSRSLAVQPFSANSLYNRSRMFVTQQKYAQAAADLSFATAIDPADPWKWHFFGVALFFLARYEHALHAFYRAVDGHNREGTDMLPFELDWIWNCYAKLGDLDAARACVQDITEETPVDPHEITYKQRLLLYAGRVGPEEFAGTIPPENYERIGNHMFAVSNYYYYMKKDYRKAAEALEKCLSVPTAGQGSWGYKMGILEKDERFAKAEICK